MASRGQATDAFTSSLLQKLDGELICGICLEFYKRPLLLPCGHNFCQECVFGLVNNFNSFSVLSLSVPRSFNCPVCHFAVSYRSGNIELPINIVLENIVSLYKECSPVGIFDGPWLNDIKMTPTTCKVHSLKEDMFCDSCSIAACEKCVQLNHSGKNAKHRVEPLDHCAISYQVSCLVAMINTGLVSV